MSKNKISLFIAFFLIILPFIGFPKTWEDNLTVIIGLLVLFITYLHVREGRLRNGTKSQMTKNESVLFDRSGNMIGREVNATLNVVIDNSDNDNTPQA